MVESKQHEMRRSRWTLGIDSAGQESSGETINHRGEVKAGKEHFAFWSREQLFACGSLAIVNAREWVLRSKTEDKEKGLEKLKVLESAKDASTRVAEFDRICLRDDLKKTISEHLENLS
jgi:hypothetical protein